MAGRRTRQTRTTWPTSGVWRAPAIRTNDTRSSAFHFASQSISPGYCTHQPYMYYCIATELIPPMKNVRERTMPDHFSLFNYLQRKSICCLHRLKGADLKGVCLLCVPGNFEIVRLFNYVSCSSNILLLTLMNGVRSRKV